MKKYSVIWKGKVVCELSRRDIQSDFERGRFGQLHCIKLQDGRELNLPDFLNDPKLEETLEEKLEQSFAPFDFKLFGFVLCGLSFLSFYIYVAVLMYSIFLFASKRKQLAGLIALLGSCIFFAGHAFFKALDISL